MAEAEVPEAMDMTDDLVDMMETARDRDGIPHEVRRLFEDLTFELIDRGIRHYSARGILHRIRWEIHLERGDATFKCNNNWTPVLARDFMAKYPAHKGFFSTRKRKAT